MVALHEQEQAHLLELPETSFSNVLVYTGRVDKYSTVIVDKNRYSVPTGNVGLEVSVSLGADRILIHYKQQELASHKRLYGNNKWQLDPDHYLDLIYRKPGAFESARPILQWRSTWPECLEKLLRRFTKSQGDTKGIKDFLTVLMLYREYPAEEIIRAVQQAVEKRISSNEGVRHLLLASREENRSAVTLDGWDILPATDVAQYAQLGGVL